MSNLKRLESLCTILGLPADATERDLELAVDRMCGIRRAKTILPPSYASEPVSVPAHRIDDATAQTAIQTVKPGRVAA